LISSTLFDEHDLLALPRYALFAKDSLSRVSLRKFKFSHLQSTHCMHPVYRYLSLKTSRS